jgi:Protein of unknown function (DUF1194)
VARLLTSWLRTAVLVLAMVLAVGPPARAQTAVDLQLVLAVDVSGSVSDERFLLQQRGYASAFRNPRLLEAIKSGKNQGIAVTMTQWTGPTQQMQVVPWTAIVDEASMLALADAVEKATRQMFGGGTSISGAIDHAMALFPESGFASPRRVIDISGDGANNRGRPAADARDEAVRAGITINGLPILSLEPSLDQYYWTNVVGGPNAFVVVAASYETFAEAVLKKLITEISALEDGDGDRTGHAPPAPDEAELP